MTFEQGSAFWQFSLTLYKEEAFQKECLFLQETTQSDVNLILFGLFAAAHQHRLTPTETLQLLNISQEWRQDYVLPLRHLRTKLKTLPVTEKTPLTEELRDKIKIAEIIAEKNQQENLAFALSDISEKPLCASPEIFTTYAQSNLYLLENLKKEQSEAIITLARRAQTLPKAP